MEQLESAMPAIWVALWALGVIAFLVWFFREMGGWRGFLLWVLMLIALIASVFLQDALMGLRGYTDFAAAAARIGEVILIIGVVGLVFAMATGVVLTIRKGKPGHWKNDVDSVNRGAFFQAPGSPLLMKRSKLKTLYSSGSYVQMESLVDGTATKNDRIIFIAVLTALTSFLLVFVGLSLMWIKETLFWAILPIGAGAVLYSNVRIAWNEYRAAKEKLASRQRGDEHSEP